MLALGMGDIEQEEGRLCCCSAIVGKKTVIMPRRLVQVTGRKVVPGQVRKR